MAKAIRAHAGGASEKKILSRSLRIYQKLAIFFVVLSLLLLLAVLYLSVSRATVKVTPVLNIVTTTTTVDITANPTVPGEVTGFAVSDTFVKAKTFTLPSEGGSPVEQKATGKVTLINETATRTDLVATTRLLSEEGVLFRLDNAVSIPANGQVEAAVSADVPGKSGEIGPTQFTIPGLGAAKQEVVYAVSVEPMVGGVVYIRSLTETDLTQAEQELANEILVEAKASLAEGVDSSVFDGEVFKIDVVEKKADTEPGTQTGTFNVSLTASVIGVFFDRELITTQARESLYSTLEEGYELVKVNEEGLQVDVRSVNVDSERATLGLYLDGVSRVAATSDVFDLDAITGKSAADAEAILEASEAIGEVDVIFTPFWLKRIPTLKDHIKIMIRDVE